VLVDFLCANDEVFAWSPSDMPGIPREVAEHSLDIRAGARPVKQSLLHFDEEKHRAIGEEVHKLLAAGFIKEVFHPEWLSNPVLFISPLGEHVRYVLRLHFPASNNMAEYEALVNGLASPSS
jgi:hypothetical protein